MRRVFLSYSGPLSHKVALALQDWARSVVDVEFFVASRNLQPGLLWVAELARHLRTADHAVLCVTPGSTRSPWILFEAGAVFAVKGFDVPRVIPYLLDVSPSRLPSPLQCLQAVSADRAGTFRLLQSLNTGITEEAFSERWPSLERKLRHIRAQSRLERALRGFLVPSRFRRSLLSVLPLLVLLGGVGYDHYVRARAIFPDFERALEAKNTANSSPIQVEYRRCDRTSRACPRGYFHSFDAALAGGYATLMFNRLLAIDLQGRTVRGQLRFRQGNHTLELGLTDTAGNTAFFNCQSSDDNVVFAAALAPEKLLENRCRLNPSSIKKFSIGFAAGAGSVAGVHGFDLYDLTTVIGPVRMATACELRRCSEAEQGASHP